MLYKLYKNEFKSPPPSERKKLFEKLYTENGVELIGVWRNKHKPLEYYMLTKYQDENHYKEFVSKIKQNNDYTNMTKRVNEVRLSNEIVDLVEAN